VVLGKPIAGIAKGFGVLSEVDAVEQGLRGRRSRRDRNKVEHSQMCRHVRQDATPVALREPRCSPDFGSEARPRWSRNVVPV
jgi:hypothetical protein